ncbi:hypothetical protein ColKHC_13632 [Colletotrichum higginsianum]|nr:hypothetical protein ColKHC_13632 [Colletotrichum higginsianum]
MRSLTSVGGVGGGSDSGTSSSPTQAAAAAAAASARLVPTREKHQAIHLARHPQQPRRVCSPGAGHIDIDINIAALISTLSDSKSNSSSGSNSIFFFFVAHALRQSQVRSGPVSSDHK